MIKMLHSLRVSLLAALSLLCAFPVMAQDIDVQALFDEAMLQREQGNFDEAIKAFQSILSNQPDLQRARLELAVAYLQTLNFEQARKHAQQVLDDPATPTTVKQRIREFLARVELASPRHTWIPKVSFGYLYDSNVTAGPDSSILSAFPAGSVVGKKGDSAMMLNAGATHRYISGRSISAGDSSAAFLWLSQFNVSRTDYSDKDYGDYDLSIASISTGPSLIANRWRAGINLQYDYVRLDEDQYGNFTSVNPHVTLIRGQRKTEITLDGLYQRRDYRRAADADRVSNFNSAGVSVGHLLANSKLSLQGGVRLFVEDANLDYYSNDGTELFVGMNYAASKALGVYAQLSRKEVEYDAVDPAVAVQRDEAQNRMVAGLNYTIASGPLADWTVKASVTRTDNNSNASLYDYDRTQTAVILERAF